MGKKKSRQTNTSTYQFYQPPPNPYYERAARNIEGYDGGAQIAKDMHARNTNSINESGNSFFGANLNPMLADRQRESRLFRNNTELGQNLAGAKQNEIQTKQGAYMGLGAATSPIFAQSGGTQYGENWGSGLYSPLGQFGLNAASAGVSA